MNANGREFIGQQESCHSERARNLWRTSDAATIATNGRQGMTTKYTENTEEGSGWLTANERESTRIHRPTRRLSFRAGEESLEHVRRRNDGCHRAKRDDHEIH